MEMYSSASNISNAMGYMYNMLSEYSNTTYLMQTRTYLHLLFVDNGSSLLKFKTCEMISFDMKMQFKKDGEMTLSTQL